MESNGVQLHDVEVEGIHYDLTEEATPNDAPEMGTLGVEVPRDEAQEEGKADISTPEWDVGYVELLEVMQGLEAQTWDMKKRFETVQDMIEDVADGPTFEASHRESLLDTSKTLGTDLQEMYRTIRALLKHKAPEYQTGVWKKSPRSRK